MKKLLLILTILIITLVLTLTYSDNNLIVNTDKINLSKDRLISLSFNNKYNIESTKVDLNKELENKLIKLSKKTTYLLLGSNNESSEEYYERHKAFLSMKYSPEIPKKDNEYDKTSREYKMSQISSISIPGMFLTLNNLNTKYSTIGNVEITYNNQYYISQVTLPSITMLEENENTPQKYNTVTTNLIINYYYIYYNNNYYLYYLNAYTKNDLSNYSDSTFAIQSDVNDSSIYNYSNYNNLSTNEINKTFDSNKNNIFAIESFNTHEKISSSIAVLVSDGIILTTYDFLKSSLEDASYISLKDTNNKYYDIDGIITISKENNLVLLKLEDKLKSTISIDDKADLEEAVVTISYDDEFTKNKSLIVSNNIKIKTLEQDDNSTLLFKDNKLLGITNSNVESIYKEYSKLTNINKTLSILNKTKYDDIDTKSFDYLKEKYFIDKSIKYKEITIPKDLYNKYKILNTINNNISIPLINYSKVGNNISLRYKNNINNYFSNIELSKRLESKLIENKYKKILTSSNKCIYENNKYQIITYSELDYLIVMVVIL